ncbi:EthD domain-containing protein [Sphingosinicella terrae]|uniref:EthD domain-containing protein n=1 Tax=Sphingosinicella terrae TaxID=2172047 RepID=UPI000E0D425F|nr:EthD domain-containing protein [Sphingosinicella terrae]
MEKLVYALWSEGRPRSEFNRDLLEEVAPRLLDLGARGLHLDLVDETVGGHALPFPQATKPPIEAALHLWVDSAIDRCREKFDLVVAAHARLAAYLVTESQPVAPPPFAGGPGTPSEGYAQLVFMRRPNRFQPAEWLEYWFNHHTERAVEDHVCTYYAQNVVVRPVTYAAPPYDAIVEEIYPLAALEDPAQGYKPGVDIAVYQASAVRMIDPAAIDVIATRQYVFKPPYG